MNISTFFAFVLLSISCFAQRDTIDINNNWSFCIDKNAEGIGSKWFSKSLKNSYAVNIPHTWNVDSVNQNHYGWAWYQRKISAPKFWKNKLVRVEFGAVNHTAFVYLNGTLILEHKGDGFNKFLVDLTNKLLIGQENTLTVAVNNDYGKEKIPYGSSFDWPNDGGIIRPVKLIISEKQAILQILATPTLNVETNEGKVDLQLHFIQKEDIQLFVSVSEENQKTKNSVLFLKTTPEWTENTVNLSFLIPKINPWHFDFPNLYRIEVKVLKGKTVVDQVSTNIGFREVKFENGKTLLNGVRVKLMGVEWTAGSNPDFGFAESDSLIIAMGKLMKNVNCIFSRQHFQQGDVFYDFCDRNGILVQQELPLWGPETPANETINMLAKKQLKSMIHTLYNHPSIFSWGVGNELRATDSDMKPMIIELLNEVRSIDPTRSTAYVSNSLTYSFFNNPNFIPDASSKGDYLMMNEYGGSWWDIPTGLIGTYLDSVHLTYPTMPFFISEFGLCEPNFKGGDVRRAEDLIYHMAIYESKPYIEGAIYFDLTDYRTHYPGTSDTTKFKRRVHGVYDMYGNPKPSMTVLRELSSPVEVQQARTWAKGKLNLLIFGAVGLPQHLVKGYKVYVSDQTDNFLSFKSYDLPDLTPGQRIDFEVDDLFPGKNIVTIVRPTGFVVTQKAFNWNEKDQ